jgi:alcohol dehydrogenase class IV
MATTFTFQSPWSIQYGNGETQTIGRHLALNVSTATILISDPALVDIGITSQIADTLASEGAGVHLFSEVPSDPTSQSIDDAAALIRQTKPGTVIGLGGGSALDVAKLATVLGTSALNADQVALGAADLPAKAARLVLVPTTAGTGAEVTRTVVFSTTEHRKLWAWGDALAADVVILDPELTLTLPPRLTAVTGLDALVHAIEACTNRNTHPMAQALGLQAIRLVHQYLLHAITAPQNLEARGSLLIAATLAGMAIDTAGTAIAHCMGHALASLTRIHHGHAVALALDTVLSHNAAAAPEPHAIVAAALGIPPSHGTVLQRAQEGVAVFHDLLHASGVTTSLHTKGLGLHDAERLVALMQAAENRPMLENNCYTPDQDVLRRFAEQLLTR